jgi:hypothetical protein
MAVKQKEIEFSPVWVENNPTFFTASVLKFLEDHPTEDWDITVKVGSSIKFKAVAK